MRRRRPALGVLLGIVLAGCDGMASPTPGVSAVPAPVTQQPSHGAAPSSSAPSAPASSVPSAPPLEEAIAVGDDKRVVDLFVPRTPPAVLAPLLILLHASGESTFAIAAESDAGELADREGVIVAIPPARGRRWDGMVSGVDPITPSADAAYLVGLIDQLIAERPIDPKRVFIAGFSIGAVMSERLACEFADRISAVALNAGAPWSDECAPARPVPILVMHGTADTTFPIALARQVVHRWRTIDGCTGEAVLTRLSDIATSEVNDHCADGVRVQFVTYAGIGHRWFADPSATDVLWSFFAALAPR